MTEVELARCNESAAAMLKVITEELPRVMAQRDAFRVALQEVHYGINEYLQEHGQEGNGLTDVLLAIDCVLKP